MASPDQKSDDYRKRIKDDRGSAESYTKRKERKHNAEMALVHRGLALVKDVKTVLDAPCGTGRASVLLARAGYEVTSVDLGQGAVEVTREILAEKGLQANVLQDDIEHMQFADDSFDAVLCFRLFHHFPHISVRESVVRELCRVSGNYVLMSYLSPTSYTSLKRRGQNRLFGKPIKQHATPLSEVVAYFEKNGFSLVQDIPQQRFLHSLHLAVFQRKA